jgi:integrase
VVKVSRRLGHSSPVITLSTYAHLLDDGDDGAAVLGI